jgi:hypothetical protein
MWFDARVVGKRKLNDDQVVVLDHIVLDGADFSGRKLVQFSAAGCRFTNSDFTLMSIDDGAFGAGRDRSEYLDCHFDGSRITFGPGGHARFVRCSFGDVDLRDWMCSTVELVDCTFSGVLRTAVFNGTVPREQQKSVGRDRNDFRGNDFSACRLIDVGFRTGIDLEAQRLPTGPDYLYVHRADRALAAARTKVDAWADAGKRSQIAGFMRLLEMNVAGGQSQLFLSADTYSSVDRGVLDEVFEILRLGDPSGS